MNLYSSLFCVPYGAGRPACQMTCVSSQCQCQSVVRRGGPFYTAQAVKEGCWQLLQKKSHAVTRPTSHKETSWRKIAW